MLRIIKKGNINQNASIEQVSAAMAHTRATHVLIDGCSMNDRLDWWRIFFEVMVCAKEKGLEEKKIIKIVRESLVAAWVHVDRYFKGVKIPYGYDNSVYMPERINIAFRKPGAINAFRAIMNLAGKAGIEIDIAIKWHNNRQAKYPGETQRFML